MFSIFRLNRDRDRRIALLSAPIVGGMLSQTVQNLVDTAMVGRLNATALAAVGMGATATWLSVSILLGIGSATQALVARRMGEEKPAEAGEVLDNALLLGGIAGLLVAGAIYLLAPSIFLLLSGDEEVAELGTGYLRMRTIGFPFVVLNFAFRGFYHGIGDTRTYLKAIFLTNLLNVILDLLLIFGLFGFPRMEARGAGLATALGLMGGTFYYVLRAAPATRLRQRYGGLSFKKICRETCRKVASIMVPNGLQSMGFAMGILAFYWMMGRIGTMAVAVTNLMINISSVFYLPALGMGLAAATLVGQALGRREPDEAEAWGWETVRLSVYIFTTTGLLMAAFPGPILRLFTNDPMVISEGMLALRITAAGQFAIAVTMVLSNVLISAGQSRFVAASTVICTYLVSLPLTYYFCVMLGGGVALGWLFQGLGRLVTAIALILKFRTGSWKTNTM